MEWKKCELVGRKFTPCALHVKSYSTKVVKEGMYCKWRDETDYTALYSYRCLQRMRVIVVWWIWGMVCNMWGNVKEYRCYRCTCISEIFIDLFQLNLYHITWIPMYSLLVSFTKFLGPFIRLEVVSPHMNFQQVRTISTGYVEWTRNVKTEGTTSGFSWFYITIVRKEAHK